MKEIVGLATVVFVIGLGVLFTAVDVSFGVKFLAAIRLIGVVVAIGAVAGICFPDSPQRIWPLLLPGAWLVAWPILRAKGERVPEFMVERGVEQAYEVWAGGMVLWGVLVLLTLGAGAWYWWARHRY